MNERNFQNKSYLNNTSYDKKFFLKTEENTKEYSPNLETFKKNKTPKKSDSKHLIQESVTNKNHSEQKNISGLDIHKKTKSYDFPLKYSVLKANNKKIKKDFSPDKNNKVELKNCFDTYLTNSRKLRNNSNNSQLIGNNITFYSKVPYRILLNSSLNNSAILKNNYKKNLKIRNKSLNITNKNDKSKIISRNEKKEFSAKRNLSFNKTKDKIETKLRGEGRNKSCLEKETEDKIDDSSRGKIKLLKNTLNNLVEKQKNNKPLIEELEKICADTFIRLKQNNNHSVSAKKENKQKKEDISYMEERISDKIIKENTKLKKKINELDKKFDVMESENYKLKEFIKNKTNEFDDIKSVLSFFQKDLENLKNNRQNIINTLSKKKDNQIQIKNNYFNYNKHNIINKSGQFNKNLNVVQDNTKKYFVKEKSKEKENLTNKNFHHLDTLTICDDDCSLENFKEIYYFPLKVTSKHITPDFVPRLTVNSIHYQETPKSVNEDSKQEVENDENFDVLESEYNDSQDVQEKYFSKSATNLNEAFVEDTLSIDLNKNFVKNNLNKIEISYSPELCMLEKSKKNFSNTQGSTNISTKPDSNKNFVINVDNQHHNIDFQFELMKDHKKSSPSWRKLDNNDIA